MSTFYDTLIFIEKTRIEDVAIEVIEILLSKSFSIDENSYLIFNDLEDETEKDPIELNLLEKEKICKELISWPGGGGFSLNYKNKFSCYMNYNTNGDFYVDRVTFSIKNSRNSNVDVKEEMNNIISWIKGKLNYKRIIGDDELLQNNEFLSLENIVQKKFEIDIINT